MTVKQLRIVHSAVPTSPPREGGLRGSARVVIVDDRNTARSLLEGLARRGVIYEQSVERF